MAFIGLLMFLVGLLGLKSEYFGDKWKGTNRQAVELAERQRQADEASDDLDRRLEHHLHYGIISIWSCVLIGPLLMLLSPWDCSRF
jgi:hypothetical protein